MHALRPRPLPPRSEPQLIVPPFELSRSLDGSPESGRPFVQREREIFSNTIPCVRTPHTTLLCEFAERRKFYTEYVHFGATFGILIPEYVVWEVIWNTWNAYVFTE